MMQKVFAALIGEIAENIGDIPLNHELEGEPDGRLMAYKCGGPKYVGRSSRGGALDASVSMWRG